MQHELPKPAELSADEWLVILSYRRCCERRQAVIRLFANRLADEVQLDHAEVIPFPNKGGS